MHEIRLTDVTKCEVSLTVYDSFQVLKIEPSTSLYVGDGEYTTVPHSIVLHCEGETFPPEILALFRAKVRVVKDNEDKK
jgi:hypothetical protein|tara:strand:- start:940 stop:1176 length:237 start_codon:yes stop_codon:yes gene_type:complete